MKIILALIATLLLAPATAQAAPVALGFQDDRELLYNAHGKREALLDQMEKAGASRVRVNLYPSYLRDFGGFAPFDALIHEAAKRRIKVQVTIVGDPYWVKNPEPLNWRNPDPREMASFARMAATHFLGRVDRYSIWNEPNISGFLGVPMTVRAKAYRRMYDAGRAAILSVDRRAKVMLGEFAPGKLGRKSGEDALTFLRHVVGKRPLTADAVAFHPYTIGNPARRLPKWRREQGRMENIAHMAGTLRALNRRGLLRSRSGKTPQMWLTEFGFRHNRFHSAAKRKRYMATAWRMAHRYGARQIVQYQVTAKPVRTGPGTGDYSMPIGTFARFRAATT